MKKWNPSPKTYTAFMDYIDDMSLALPNQQQVGESNVDFKRFQYYLALGAGRSLSKVSENFSLTENFD